MIPALALCLLIASAAAVSRVCSNPQDVCNEGAFCVKDKFCLADEAEDYHIELFAAGLASAFVDPNNAEQAKCLVRVDGEVNDFNNALRAWENGEYVSSGEYLYSAVGDLKSTIATCMQENSGTEETFWDEVWHGIELVINGLCSECGAIITEGEYVIQGVDIIEDWYTMSQTCTGEYASTDDMIDCGAAFGDSIKRIINLVED